MRTIPRFYLNESVLDDLMNDPDYQSGGMSSSEKMTSNVILSSTNNDDYPHAFKFRITGLVKKKKLDWYFDNLRQFQEDFTEMMDINRYVRDYNHQLIFAFDEDWRRRDAGEQQVVYEVNDLFFKCYEDEDVNKLLPASGNELSFTIGINAVIEDIFQLRKMMLILYRTFKNSINMSFKSQARAYILSCVKRGEQFPHCNITESDYNQWKELPKTFDRSMKEMCRSAFPLRPKDIQKQLDEWRNARMQSGKIKVDMRAIDLLKNLGLYDGRETVKFNESDKSVIVDVNSGRKWEPTKLNQLISFIDNYEYNITIKGIYGLHIGFNYVDNQIDDVYKLLDIIDDSCRRIFVQIQNTMQLMQKYNGKTIDLVAMFPGYKVDGTVINCNPKTVVKNLKDYDLYDYTVKVKKMRQIYNQVYRKYVPEIYIETYKPTAFQLKK